MRFHQLWKAASLALVAVALLICPVARADGDAELIRARKLYAQGLTQEAAGDWAGALATFEDVARIRATPQVRFHLARCKEHLGRFNEALGGYRIAEYEAEQAASKEPTLLDEVRKARVALEGRIPKLTIARGKGAEAIRIELDGVALGDTQIGQPIALDPGPHVVTGIVERGKTFKKTLNVAEGDAVRVELDVPDELVEQPVAPPLATNPVEPPRGPAEPPGPPARQARSAAPWIIGGIGVASLAASAVFYSLRAKAEDELDQGCLGRTCPDTLKGTQQNGETYAALTGVTLGIGVVGVGAGVLMLLGQKSPAPSSTPPAAALQLGRGAAEVSFRGRF
mgnify:CR=1 FL=1